MAALEGTLGWRDGRGEEAGVLWGGGQCHQGGLRGLRGLPAGHGLPVYTR